jgi:molybdopterin-guanine dinucleotide biosynthesis protein A
MIERRDAEGFVLVGGRSSRMGADKATLPYHDLPLATWIAQQMEPAVDRVSLVGDPQIHGGLGIPIVPDFYPGSGPVGALVTALRSSCSTWNVMTACDLPAVTPRIFQAMLRQIRQSDAQCLVPVTPDGRRQVLCAVYRRDAAGPLLKAFQDGELRLRFAIDRLETHFWRADSDDWAVNLNTPEDWAAYAPAEIA